MAAKKIQQYGEENVIRAMQIRNVLLSNNDATWLGTLLTQKPEYEQGLRMVLGTAGWMFDLASSPYAIQALVACEAGRREIAASATAMREIAAVAAAVNQVIAVPEALATVVASATAMTAISASATAMTAISASATARAAIWSSQAVAWAEISASGMAVGKYAAGCAGLDPAGFADISAVAASSVAMQAVAASSVAMQAVAASTEARAAIWRSDTALTAIQNNNAAVTAIINSGRAITTAATASAQTFVSNGVKIILLRRWYSSSSATEYLQWTRTNNTLPGYGVTAKKYGVNYAETASVPTSNSSTANNVRACNGLSVASSGSSSGLQVIYLTV